MKLCVVCGGLGFDENGEDCNSCLGDGIIKQTPSFGKTYSSKSMSHADYEIKRQKSIKFDKKNSRSE